MSPFSPIWLGAAEVPPQYPEAPPIRTVLSLIVLTIPSDAPRDRGRNRALSLGTLRALRRSMGSQAVSPRHLSFGSERHKLDEPLACSDLFARLHEHRRYRAVPRCRYLMLHLHCFEHDQALAFADLLARFHPHRRNQPRHRRNRRIAAANRSRTRCDLNVFEHTGAPIYAEMQHAAIPGELRCLLDASEQETQTCAVLGSNFNVMALVCPLDGIGAPQMREYFCGDSLFATADQYKSR